MTSVSASLSTLRWTKPQNYSDVSTCSTYMFICTVLCISELIYDSVCFQEAYKDRGWGGFIWALSPLVSNRNWKTCICVLLFATVCFQEAYSNCGGIYLSLVPVGQVIRLTQQERPPAHFCQRWKNKDSIPHSWKRKNYLHIGIFFMFFSSAIFVFWLLSMRLIYPGVLICR